MKSYEIKLKKATPNQTTSKMFSHFLWPKNFDEHRLEDYICLLQLNLEEISEHPLPVKDGWLQFFVSKEDLEVELLYIPKNTELIIINSDEEGYDVEFEGATNNEGIRLFGKPCELNETFDDFIFMLLQYDPLADERLTFLNHVDGFLYIMIHQENLDLKNWELAFSVLDRT
jgi:uncharacterized protein YwqG